MRTYECVFVLDAALNEAQVNEEVQKIVDLAKSNGAASVKVNNWGKREIAYLVDGKRFGTYIALDIMSTNHAIVAELQRVLSITDAVIKYQTTVIHGRKRKFRGNPKRVGTFTDFDSDDRMDSYF